jgi:hypothetical protein
MSCYGDDITVVVCGLHTRGFPLGKQLLERDAPFHIDLNPVIQSQISCLLYTLNRTNIVTVKRVLRVRLADSKILFYCRLQISLIFSNPKTLREAFFEYNEQEMLFFDRNNELLVLIRFAD